MTKKTRIRVARIAAGVVIAAGASLTAAGAASALGNDVGVTLPDGDPTATPTETGIPSGPATPTTEPATTPPATPIIPSTPTGPATPTTTPPTDEPTDPTENPTEPTDPTDSPTDGSGTGGNDSNPDGGSKPVEQGKGSSGLTDTGANTSSDTSAQGKKGQLAETGAAETTFLLVGAATMIAGGIGFRLLPRLVNGRGAAA
ncbi:MULTISPECIES: LPXTG cell wall anchor domain-containing protein [Streptomyces]|uniref:LPXTG cell wall anchor domain-containing protein n=1 Tax=Streptomyces mirabilis TaxID=68239 RepID=A0ABU3USS0_9ACTN|nr:MULTISPECIES: LPXTG cell wall anchor domain-containing protein [Streptomyces]MCX5349653.1 LPXTG cell wall anchor domain-containing protein [Streptomyces mirabilis]MDU8996967.1 LPXTG cell wall anchor domain-containing protein [Streptomyces mirabilis]QDN88100.1 LPXTG cell wall anchor domain-containing protein [Streptomyces sp. RLB3-6]QDO08935.1 LPXTG cell wall anchor domain-containing protein [Streptomyces sp. S1D4-23]